MATYGHTLAGANSERRTTYKEFPLGTVERANADRVMIYVLATEAVSGTCTVNAGTFAVTDLAGNWTAEFPFVTGEYGWVYKVDVALP